MPTSVNFYKGKNENDRQHVKFYNKAKANKNNLTSLLSESKLLNNSNYTFIFLIA